MTVTTGHPSVEREGIQWNSGVPLFLVLIRESLKCIVGHLSGKGEGGGKKGRRDRGKKKKKEKTVHPALSSPVSSRFLRSDSIPEITM